MRKIIITFFTVLMISTFAQTKNVSSAEIHWKGYKTLKAESLSHFGTIELKSGNINFKDDKITDGIFIMDMNKIDSEDLNNNLKLKKMFENHLKSDDFFDTARFPTSTFQIKSVKPIKDKIYNYQMSGILTIKGISKNLSFPILISERENNTTINSGKFTFNRKNFGLNYNIFEDMFISNDVEMKIKLILN